MNVKTVLELGTGIWRIKVKQGFNKEERKKEGRNEGRKKEVVNK